MKYNKKAHKEMEMVGFPFCIHLQLFITRIDVTVKAKRFCSTANLLSAQVPNFIEGTKSSFPLPPMIINMICIFIEYVVYMKLSIHA